MKPAFKARSNTACSQLVGVAAFSVVFHGLRLVPKNSIISSHQRVTQIVRWTLGGEAYFDGNDSRDSATTLMEVAQMQYPVTPDGRYFVVRGRLWRCTNPALTEDERSRLTSELMRHRAAVGRAKRAANAEAEQAARDKVHESKIALGERGPVWWADGAPDYNRYLAKNTPYRSWYERLKEEQGD